MSLPYLTLRDIFLSFGGKPLFENISINLCKGEKYCLVGRNGSGKSTLLRVIAQEIEADGGDYFLHPGIKIAYLPQDFQIEENDIKVAFQKQGIEEYIAKSYLDQLEVPLNLDITKASGGERRRLALAFTLAQEPDLLLLDEPTNHLDLPAIEWLEDYIASYQGCLVVISHDKKFLEKVSNRTLWIDQYSLRVNKKGYAHFEEWSDFVFAEEERQLEKMDAKLRLEAEWLHRGVTARRKRNQGRLRKLHSLRNERREREQNKAGKAKLLITEGDISSKLIVEALEISKSFADKKLISNFSTRILRGDRIGIIGPNGSGKTTLLKMLVGTLESDSGVIKHGANVDLVYLDQMRDSLHPNETLWQNLCPQGGDQVFVQGQPRHVMAYLKDFLFQEKQIRGLVSILSGGEKNRLALAKALARPSNVLVMDEPTNDLDMDTLDLLIELLSDYAGTLIIVSHDRDFLNKMTTSIIAFEGNGVVDEYIGGYDDYLYVSHHNPKKSTIQKKKIVSAPASQKPTNDKEKRLSYNEQRLLNQLPETIQKLESEINLLENQISDPNFYATHQHEFVNATKRLDEAKKELNNAEETWILLSLR